MTRAPVGVFDSGVGGLSVARQVRDALPAERLLFLADTAWCPYGDREEEVVRERTVACGRWLQDQGVRVLVVACNTASAAALEALREHLSIPVIGLEPAVKPAVAATRNRRVGVMATSGTLRSERFARLVRTYADGVQVLPQPCPGLVDLIEDGHSDDELLARTLDDLTGPLRAAGVDTVVLGCTHYPFVREPIARALGPDVTLLDSGEAIARRTRRVLEEMGDATEEGEGGIEFCTTGAPAEVAPVVARLWGSELPVRHVEV